MGDGQESRRGSAGRDARAAFGPLVCIILYLVVLSNKRSLNPELCLVRVKRTHSSP